MSVYVVFLDEYKGQGNPTYINHLVGVYATSKEAQAKMISLGYNASSFETQIGKLMPPPDPSDNQLPKDVLDNWDRQHREDWGTVSKKKE